MFLNAIQLLEHQGILQPSEGQFEKAVWTFREAFFVRLADVGWGLTGLFGLMAVLFLGSGILTLGKNLTPLPHPKDDGELVTEGAYGVVRHPIYSGVIFLAIAYGCWQWSSLHLVGAVGFLLFFDFKARKEELWLRNKFPGYDAYQAKIKKLIPGVY